MERVTAHSPMAMATLCTRASSGFGDVVKAVVGAFAG